MRYFIRGKIDPPITSLYRIDFASMGVERYRGKGLWTLDDNSGNVLADISGFGGSWYNIDEIGADEVEKYRLILDISYEEHKVWAYNPNFKQT